MAAELTAEYENIAGRRFDAPEGLTLAEQGETGLLQLLGAAARAVPAGPRLVIGSGDDAAVYRPDPTRDLVVSQDAVVEGVDFRREWITPYQLGARALHVALSDLAGGGARPEFCLATLCAPRSTRLNDVIALQAGLCAAAAAVGCAVAGGDVSAIDGPLVIDIAVTGSVAQGRYLGVAGGRAGDLLVVTGVLGRAAAGLALLQGRDSGLVNPATLDAWRAAQLAPHARIDEGIALAQAGSLCATDVSDGLVVSARLLAGASACQAELWRDAVPVDAELRGWTDWFDLAVAGGEDFEILAALPAALVETIGKSWPASLQKLTVVGRLVAGAGVRCLSQEGGEDVALPSSTAFHFG